MGKILEAAEPLAQVLWRGETDGKDFSTPERRAGLERALADIVSLIADGKIADYYRREFEQRVFETFKRRQPNPRYQPARGRPERQGRGDRFAPAPDPVSSAVKNSAAGAAAGARER